LPCAQQQFFINPIDNRLWRLADERGSIHRQIFGRTFQREPNNEQENKTAHIGEERNSVG
jgi:hypothetical protein